VRDAIDECTIQAIRVLLGMPKGALINLPWLNAVLRIEIHEKITNKAAGQSHKPCQFTKFAKFHELLFKRKKIKNKRKKIKKKSRKKREKKQKKREKKQKKARKEKKKQKKRKKAEKKKKKSREKKPEKKKQT
jgi:hypothetical protein